MPPARPFYYFNGFNSAILEDYSGSQKIVAVAEFAACHGYDFRPVSIAYRRARQHCLEILHGIGSDVSEVVFCGSSMGGWFARIMQLHLADERPGVRSAAIAFNPAFDLGLNGDRLLGDQVNFVTGEHYTWTQKHSDELARLEAAVDYGADLPFYVYVDKGDELIDWRRSAARHAPLSHLLLFEGGCHSFDHYREALEDFWLDHSK